MKGLVAEITGNMCKNWLKIGYVAVLITGLSFQQTGKKSPIFHLLGNFEQKYH